jgi:hypothetical protein
MKTKQQKRKLNSIFLYLLAIALALLVYSFLLVRVNMTGKVIHELQDSCTMQQIQEHDSMANCWITNDNNVYDITGLVDDINFKESDCGKEVYLNSYFQEVLRERVVGIKE